MASRYGLGSAARLRALWSRLARPANAKQVGAAVGEHAELAGGFQGWLTRKLALEIHGAACSSRPHQQRLVLRSGRDLVVAVPVLAADADDVAQRGPREAHVALHPLAPWSCVQRFASSLARSAVAIAARSWPSPPRRAAAKRRGGDALEPEGASTTTQARKPNQEPNFGWIMSCVSPSW